MQPATARYAWIASAYAGTSWATFEDWTEMQLGERLDREAVRAHVKSLRPRSTRGRRKAGEPTRTAPSEAEKRAAVMRDWWRIREDELGLRKVLLRIPGRFDEREALHRALEQIAGIRQFFELKTNYDVLAIALVRDEAEENFVRARVQDHVAWGNVEAQTMIFESQDSAALTWLALAKAQLAEDP